MPPTIVQHSSSTVDLLSSKGKGKTTVVIPVVQMSLEDMDWLRETQEIRHYTIACNDSEKEKGNESLVYSRPKVMAVISWLVSRGLYWLYNR